MVAEVTVTVKNSEKRLVTEHLIYDEFQACETDPILRDLIDDTVKQFSDDAESVKLRINIEVK